RICPTHIPLTKLFDLVESKEEFQKVLGFSEEEKKAFIDRFWQITKESPLYREHTLADHKGQNSHLDHGLKILYNRGFAYADLFIDPETCIRCGMCSHGNACTYFAREGKPREIPALLDQNCALCNACINFCPQNKLIQKEREYVEKLISNAVDREEKKYWQTQMHFLRDTTIIQRSPKLTEMADLYITEDILMEIDREASQGNIPVSGMGQGDRHMGIGFDAERFSHFHIVGPAQNRLHEGDPDEELSVILGKRHRYCKFDAQGDMDNPPYPKIKLRSPMLYNNIPLESNGRMELSLIKVAEKQNTLVVIKLHKLLMYYEFLRKEGSYKNLPPVIIPRVDKEILHHLLVNPNTQRDLVMDLWQMPAFEIAYHSEMKQTITYIQDSVRSLSLKQPLLCGYIEMAESDMIGGIRLLPHVEAIIEEFLACGVDMLHIHGLRNKDQYFVTSQAVRCVHHYLLESGTRHKVAIMASGGIRLASDSQKTIQRGAEATLLDIAALLALDPAAYRAILDKQTTTDKLMNLDTNWAIQRLNNQMESRKVQILEVLGAAGFKDIKKTVGEEGRLIGFYELEERIQKNIFEAESYLDDYRQVNQELVAKEKDLADYAPRYQDIKERIVPVKKPHDFYHLSETNQTVYQRDHVWPGWIIETVGKMASGDLSLLSLKNVKGTGLLGDGFDLMKILYKCDPDLIPEEDLNDIKTSVALDKGLMILAPWMFGGKSVGSVGLDTWKAHIVASHILGIQCDTGEGGYPTCFFLNRKGEPIFFQENDIQAMKPLFCHEKYYTIQDIRDILQKNAISRESHPSIYEELQKYPDLQPFLFYIVVDTLDEPFVSTELKTGLFGVSKESIKKARRVIIAYSQGAKMGIGGHILSQKVNKLVSYLRGVEGVAYIDVEKAQKLCERIEKIEKDKDHGLHKEAQESYPEIQRAQDEQKVFPQLQSHLVQIQQKVYELICQKKVDPIEGEQILYLCEEVIRYSYSSIISPFPFHNCYSIEDVKAFIDIVRMINPKAVISVKVSPSVDIEFIAAGLGRIAKDNTEEALVHAREELAENTKNMAQEIAEYAKKYAMTIEVWLDGPRGGTGASPNIIKGQMGMHIEYAIPLIHNRLVRDGLRNHVKFFVSGGIRTYEDVIKAIALGADGVIWGTAPLVAIGCDRNRNCHDGCSRGIATSNLIMQKLRDVETNTRQMVNVFTMMQLQVMRALAALGFKDIRELRGRYDKIQWIGLKERVDFRIRQRSQFHESSKEIEDRKHPQGQSNCGVAAIIGTQPIPSYILDHTLYSMRNRGMDGVGVGKTLCFRNYPHHYAYSLMVKGMLQPECERMLLEEDKSLTQESLREKAREVLLSYRYRLAEKIFQTYFAPYFDTTGETKVEKIRDSYKRNEYGQEKDYREFGNPNTDPGDIFRWFVRVKKDALNQFIESELLTSTRYAYTREFYPQVNQDNYKDHQEFLEKAEDLFVREHSSVLTQSLYIWQPEPKAWKEFIAKRNYSSHTFDILVKEEPLSKKNLEQHAENALLDTKEFFESYPPLYNKARYISRSKRIAAVMSCGKNMAVWKTAGREIPWETPFAPNNIIHVRLATGSVVEQMNAHPFGKLNTALTHNGETTNYETLKQRVEQFGLIPLATTDTEVAALKFQLVAEDLEYPDWALFESFSPTTGDDLALVDPEKRKYLEEVQRVEFTSSPDGPYQYLCLRHLPRRGATERVDLKDPADLRPSTTAFWSDTQGKTKRVFSMIASEEQALAQMMQLLDKEGLVDGAAADTTLVSSGMISRYHYNEEGEITKAEFCDRYGTPMPLADFGEHYSISRTPFVIPQNSDLLEQDMAKAGQDIPFFLRSHLADWDFNTYRYCLEAWTKQKGNAVLKISTFQYLIDYLRTFDTGKKAKSSLLDITRTIFYSFLDNLSQQDTSFVHKAKGTREMASPLHPENTLLVDATGFEPQGTDPRHTLACLLSLAYDKGWRKFLLYRVAGQRLISTAVMGKSDTHDVQIDIYGTPGEYLGAFMQGGTIRVHGNSQNFTAMCTRYAHLHIFGNAGKVCGYASKGGKIFILGDINDRAWTNSVNDTRGQSLQIHILGSASKYAGESLMGGDFFFGGMHFDHTGKLCTQSRPYRGTKMLGGASRGRMLFFDPNHRLDPHQYSQAQAKEITPEEWPYWQTMVTETLELAGVSLKKQDAVYTFEVDGKSYEILPKNFTLIAPKGKLKGYESH
ncbi:MAG: alpha-hydroxy-acid oxidizing protein, partial [Candidatus Brocadiae bacterium]|nr:alpha-hydroxy-acid oxidizing protein [Candidatus Brocadiia bacterium]